MCIQSVNRFLFATLLAAWMAGLVVAAEDPAAQPKVAEYKRSDTNFYPKGDVVRAHPGAVIITASQYTQKGDSYFFTPRKKAPLEMYAETLNDWIEPITPPDMPASLGVPPDAMQIREPQGDVQVALPTAPANFAPVTDGMTLPNGAVLKTGANGTAAVLFGGVDSARLMPDSEAAVQQTVTAKSRSAEVDLTAGGVFSKVGTQVGVKGSYEVHTPSGNAIVHGTDFVTIITPGRTDVWIAQGTVELVQPDGKKGGVATSDGTGPLKVIRFPQISDAHQSVPDDIETLTAALNFIPLANQKIKALRDKGTAGTALTANEQAYLNRLKKVPCLIKLALVQPPAPPPAPLIAAAPAPAPTPPVKLEPIDLDLRADGSVDFQNATLTLDELKPKLEEIAQATPAQPLIIKGREKVAHAQLKKVLAICKAAKLKKVTVAKAAPVEVATPIAPAVTAPTIAPPPPAVTPAPAPATPAIPATPAVAASPADSTAPAPIAPLRAVVRIDGKVNLKGLTFTPGGFKKWLEALIAQTPDQALVIKAGRKVPYDKFKTVMDICREAQVKNVTVVSPIPTPESNPEPATKESSAENLPAPGLIMHPTIDTTSIGAPATSTSPSTSTSTPETPPTTNAPPLPGP